MKLTKSEREVFDEFMENPFYREVVESAPSEACRDYIIRGLIYGLYGGYDPDICHESLEDGLNADDWRHVKRYLAGNTPFLLKCVTRIRELKSN